MYFITEKTSETGKKFEIIKNKLQVVRNAQQAFAKKYNFQKWRDANWVFAGRMSSCADFQEVPDSKVWKKNVISGEFFPKKSSKMGKTRMDWERNI